MTTSPNIKEKHYLLCALFSAAAVATFFALWLRGEQRVYYLYYNAPIAAPFAAFVLERALRLRRNGYVLGAFDAGVVALALARAFLPIPGYSGHVLFLLYALFSSLSKTTRVLSALVLCQVLVVKFAFWDDFVTPTGAAGLAAIALLLRAILSARQTRTSAATQKEAG